MLLPISLTTSILLKQQFLICCRMRLASCLEVQIRALQIRWLRTMHMVDMVMPFLPACIAMMEVKPITKIMVLRKRNMSTTTTMEIADIRTHTGTVITHINTQFRLISNI